MNHYFGETAPEILTGHRDILSQDLYLSISIIRENSDDALCHASVETSEDGYSFLVNSYKQVPEYFIDEFLDILDDEQFPWERLWTVAHKHRTEIVLYYFTDLKDKNGYAKVIVYSSGPDDFKEIIREIMV